MQKYNEMSKIFYIKSLVTILMILEKFFFLICLILDHWCPRSFYGTPLVKGKQIKKSINFISMTEIKRRVFLGCVFFWLNCPKKNPAFYFGDCSKKKNYVEKSSGHTKREHKNENGSFFILFFRFFVCSLELSRNVDARWVSVRFSLDLLWISVGILIYIGSSLDSQTCSI